MMRRNNARGSSRSQAAVLFALWPSIACGRTALLDEFNTSGGFQITDSSSNQASADGGIEAASGQEDTDATVTDPTKDAAATDPFFDASGVVVGSIAPCIGNVSIVHFEGDSTDPIHPGTNTYEFPPTGDIWTECGSGTSKSAAPAEVEFGCPAAEAENGSSMGFYFLSRKNTNIGPGVYEATSSFVDDGQPKMSIHATGIYGNSAHGSYAKSGRFQIERLEFDTEGSPRRVLVTFELRYDTVPDVLRGCAYYDQQVSHVVTGQ